MCCSGVLRSGYCQQTGGEAGQTIREGQVTENRALPRWTACRNTEKTSHSPRVGSYLSFQHVPREKEVGNGCKHQAAGGDQQPQPPGPDPPLVLRCQGHRCCKTQRLIIRALPLRVQWRKGQIPMPMQIWTGGAQRHVGAPQGSPCWCGKWREVRACASSHSKTSPGCRSLHSMVDCGQLPSLPPARSQPHRPPPKQRGASPVPTGCA